MFNKTPEQMLIDWGIPYKWKGENIYIQCVSGTHKDNNPSLSIHGETGVFNCWSCGFHGNMLILYKNLGGTGRDFFKQYSDQEYNGNCTLRSFPKTKKRRKKMSKILHVEGDVFPVNGSMLSILNDMGVYKQSFIEEYGITWTPFAKFISEDREDEFPTTFYKRILIPIYYKGKLINIEGRTYQNGITPKVIYPKGGWSDILFNYEKVDLSKPVILVEGIKDFFKVWNVNKNVISCLGNNLGPFQLNQVNTIKDLIVFMDDDEGGEFLLDKLDEEYDHDFRVIDPREGRDPNDLTLREVKSKLEVDVETYWEYLGRKYPMEDHVISLGGEG